MAQQTFWIFQRRREASSPCHEFQAACNLITTPSAPTWLLLQYACCNTHLILLNSFIQNRDGFLNISFHLSKKKKYYTIFTVTQCSHLTEDFCHKYPFRRTAAERKQSILAFCRHKEASYLSVKSVSKGSGGIDLALASNC